MVNRPVNSIYKDIHYAFGFCTYILQNDDKCKTKPAAPSQQCCMTDNICEWRDDKNGT